VVLRDLAVEEEGLHRRPLDSAVIVSEGLTGPR
jgi:hypothetical protein